MFHGLFQLSSKIQVFVNLFTFFFTFILWSTGIAKSTRWQVLFFLLIHTRSDLLTGLGNPFESQRILGVSFSRRYSVFIIITTTTTILKNRDIGPAVRVFANGPGDLGSIPGRVIPKTLKMELDTTLLNTQHYKVRFKGKVEQSREWSSALPYTLV